MSVRLADFARRPPLVRLQPDGLVAASELRKTVDHLRRQLEKVGDIPGKAITVETRDPFCAMVSLVALWALGGVGVPVDPQATPPTGTGSRESGRRIQAAIR
jgi:long-subunit acyl-CoA synthetase (AMP-forming)